MFVPTRRESALTVHIWTGLCYTSSMTMKRTEKLDHSMNLKVASQNSGYTAEDFAKPELRRKALAETGHMMMPATDYRVLRMGRKISSLTRRDVVVSKMQKRRGR